MAAGFELDYFQDRFTPSLFYGSMMISSELRSSILQLA